MTRWRRWLGRALAIAVAVGVTTRLRDREVQPEDWQGPYLVAGEVGEPVAIRDYTLTVAGVDGGKLLGAASRIPSAGVWVVVDVQVASHDRPVAPESIVLVDGRGRMYAPTNRFDDGFMSIAVQPGMVASGAIAFEVPLDVGTDLWVRAQHDPDPRLDRATNVHIAIDPDEWARWTAEDSVLDVRPRTVAAA